MGYSVLYIAFGIVALWLLGEVLLQYKARLRWRVLAFTGFLGVVGGVALREVVVIVLGAVAFGAGQSFVTLSYKRGFSTGWALGGQPGSSRRRKGSNPRAAEPVLEVTPVEAEESREEPFPAAAYDLPAPEAGPQVGQDGQIYQPMPLQDDSGEYPLYDGQSTYTPDPYTSGGYEGYGAQGYGDWSGEPHPAAAAAAAASYDSGGGYEQQPQQQQQQPGSGWGEQAYGYEQAPYGEQQPAAAAAGYDAYGRYTGTGTDGGGTDGGGTNGGYGYGGYQGQGYDSGQGAGDWQSQQPYPQQQSQQQPGADPYGTYGYDQQSYIPPQQHQSPYEQPGQQPAQPTYAGEPAPEYADPYDPYRY
jgi:hypothetical protein